MINDKIKKTLSLFTILIATIINIKVCYAFGLEFENISESNGGEAVDEEVEFSEWFNYGVNNKLYRYRYKQEIKTASSIYANAYNMKGESLIPNSAEELKNHLFKAGTWVGINVTETHTAIWKVYDLQYQEVKYKYTCTYKIPGDSYTCPTGTYVIVSEATCKTMNGIPQYNSRGNYSRCEKTTTCYEENSTITPIKDLEKDYNEPYECPEKYGSYKLAEQKEKEEEISVENQGLKNTMKESAVTTVRSMAISYVEGWTSGEIRYVANNTYPEDSSELIYNTIDKGASLSKIQDITNPDGVSGKSVRQYELLEKNVCMNVKTGVVSYGKECNAEKGEVKIETGTIKDTYLDENVNYWHYFIPLNVKGNLDFSLDVIENGSVTFPITTCEIFMKNRPDYKNYILPYKKGTEIDLGTFIGDYHKYENKDLSIDWQKIKNSDGCQVSAKISFPIVQEFYNEVGEDKNKKFRGFNFYYKPIDIENPFPNGIPTNSLWNKWEESSTKNPELSKSFDTVTYIASDINVEKVRKYTQNNPYTSWSNMNIDGKSNFINSEGIVTREYKTNFYKLGCGPLNEKEYLDDGKTNILYQERCKS